MTSNTPKGYEIENYKERYEDFEYDLSELKNQLAFLEAEVDQPDDFKRQVADLKNHVQKLSDDSTAWGEKFYAEYFPESKNTPDELDRMKVLANI